ncbi:hypothetical protein VTJ49DRAFT_1514 [Mycothermus thermophilus]|uniref:Uncharacterized protein n=1 Tax=Humicola insolens TaxID=85995 RepID=A0ABR3VC81_HUMIN
MTHIHLPPSKNGSRRPEENPDSRSPPQPDHAMETSPEMTPVPQAETSDQQPPHRKPPRRARSAIEELLDRISSPEAKRPIHKPRDGERRILKRSTTAPTVEQMPRKPFGHAQLAVQGPLNERLPFDAEGSIGETLDGIRVPPKKPSLEKGVYLGPLAKRCQHSTMSPITQPPRGKPFECSRCRQVPESGIMYACTVDEDRAMFDQYSRDPDSFIYDDIGRRFAKEMSLGPNGPDVRSRNASSIVEEMTPEQRTSYTPEQLHKLIEQRQQVRVLDSLTKAREANKPGHNKKLYGPDTYPFDDRPWVPSPGATCSYKLCLYCLCLRRKTRDKTYISLDAVLKGTISPTLAVGYSFSLERSRPVADVNVVRNIGCRPVPMPKESLERVQACFTPLPVPDIEGAVKSQCKDHGG